MPDNTIHVRTKYIDEDVVIWVEKYTNGSTALTLFTPDGFPLATATVALEILPEEGNVFIKDWSENDGMLRALQEAKVVGPLIRSIPTGFVQAHEVKLLLSQGDS